MFDYLKAFSKTVVTGPQRSGTRVASKMIAMDTGLRFVGEEEIHVDSLNTLVEWLRMRDGFVIQCPALCRYMHQIVTDEVAVVMMMRPVDEIVASQEHIGWIWEEVELLRYATGGAAVKISELKYGYWRNFQKGRITNAFEVQYHSLHDHPYWLPPHLRVNFAPRQTE